MINKITSNKKNILIFLLIATFITSFSLLLSKMYWGHDLVFHLSRIRAIKDNLNLGVVGGYMYPNYLDGYGYGNPLFYPDIFLYIPAIISYLGLSILSSYKLFLVLINFLTFLTMYITIKSITGNKKSAIVSSIMYGCASYKLIDMYTRAEKLHIETDVKRVVYIIETKHEKDTNALETVRTLFANKTRDFITAVDEKSIILVKEVKGNESYEELDKTADVIIDMLSTEAMSAAHVAYGTIVNDIREVSRSYKEAKMALDVGKIFYSNKNVVAYNRLGIGRLIYQLPIPLCQMFIKEIFEGKAPDDFDDETLSTINKFFENSLNVSETSRQLYIHRNTLVYRLDKIQKTTGLDLRVFDDAITFKIALMVVKYMKYMESKDTF